MGIMRVMCHKVNVLCLLFLVFSLVLNSACVTSTSNNPVSQYPELTTVPTQAQAEILTLAASPTALSTTAAVATLPPPPTFTTIPTRTPSSLTPSPSPAPDLPLPIIAAETSIQCDNTDNENSTTLLKVAYIKNNDIWIWDQQLAKTWALTDSQDISEMKLSPDHKSFAFTRGPNNNPLTLMAFEPVTSYHLTNLWVIDIDGGNERLLLSQDDLLTYRQEDTHEVVNFSQFEWLPNSRQIIYSTRGIDPLIHDYYVYPNDDLYIIDVSTRQSTPILVAGKGGVFAVSPDGEQVAIGAETGMHLVDLSKNILYDYPIEFSIQEWSVGQYIFRPWPNWAGDSSFFITITEKGGSWPNGNMMVWQISMPTNDSPEQPRLLGSYLGNILATQLSPDLKYLAVTRLGEGFEIYALETHELLLSIPGSEYEQQVIFQSWHPDSLHFTYMVSTVDGNGENTTFSDSLMYSNLCGSSIEIQKPFIWINSSEYIFALELPGTDPPGSVYRNWELRLNSVDGKSTLIERIDNQPLHWEPFVTIIDRHDDPIP